jgi:hypothetical protein
MDYFIDDYKITQGDTFYSDYYYLDDRETSYVDLSDRVIRWGVKRSLDSGYISILMPILVEKNTAQITIGGVVYPINTLYRLVLNTSSISITNAKECFIYEVEMTDIGGNKLTLQKGEFEIIKQLIN